LPTVRSERETAAVLDEELTGQGEAIDRWTRRRFDGTLGDNVCYRRHQIADSAADGRQFVRSDHADGYRRLWPISG